MWSSRRISPSSHEAKQEAGRHLSVASGPVEGEEAIPDDLGVDVPAGQRGLRCFDELCPTGLKNVRTRGDIDQP
jgi:hypothetical protein